jgi:hypothetical protein
VLRAEAGARKDGDVLCLEREVWGHGGAEVDRVAEDETQADEIVAKLRQVYVLASQGRRLEMGDE